MACAGEPPITETPLHAPPPRQGATLFERLDATATGMRLENRYAEPQMWAERFREFLFGAIGTGVAVGDYDGDGRPDVFAVSKTESSRLFRNLGDFRFEDVTGRAGVGDTGAAAMIWKQGASFADVDNDGRLDLYVCRFDAPNLLYLNQGDGTFRESARARGLAIRDASGMAAFCDYDRDGWLDVYLATNLLDAAKHPNGRRGYLLRNTGGGHFVDVSEAGGIRGESQSHSGTWWDHDGDGWPDLYVANDYGVPDKLYRNNRDGTFTDVIGAALPCTAYSSMGADAADVDNDGRVDLLVADMAATTHEKEHRRSAELRSREGEPPSGATSPPKYRRAALLLATGTSRCREAAYLAGVAATDWTWSVRFADFDNDGWRDLHISTGMFRDQDLDVNARMMSAESAVERIRIMRESPMLLEANLAFRNRGDLRFETVGAAWGLDTVGITFGVGTGDFNGDGNIDLVTVNHETGLLVYRNTADTGHRVIVGLRGTRSNRFGIGAVVRVTTAAGTQVEPVYLCRGYMSSSEPVAHFGLGAAARIERLSVSWPSGHEQVFTDLPADRFYTIAEPGEAPSHVAAPELTPAMFEDVSCSVQFSATVRGELFDELSQQRLLPFRFSRRGPALVVGDLNGDGAEDLLLGGSTTEPARAFLAQTGGRFRERRDLFEPSATLDDGPLLLFDADGDGRNDVLITRGGASMPAGSTDYQPRLHLAKGDGSFRVAREALPELPLSVGAAVAADVDRDGRLDVFLGGRVVPGAYPMSPRSALLLNRGGRFEDVTEAMCPGLRHAGMVSAALWSDVDGDGWIDLVCAVDWGWVRVFRNDSGRRLVEWTERLGFAAAGRGWWTSLAGADFNGDGRTDYVAGNCGLNTPYQASAESPAVLLAGDLRGDGTLQLVEAFHERGRLLPRRSRRDLAATLPSVRRRYTTNAAFAQATVEDILGAPVVAGADRLEATELRSGVFLSQADGGYRFQSLPRIAQIAPFQGIVARDFDGDGCADIYALQNSHAPVPATGRFAGGLSQLLLGDGRGGFEAVDPAAAGLVVPGDAKAVVSTDLDRDGWPDLVLTRQGDTTLAFRHRGSGRGRVVWIELRGPAGNPRAIGARVTLELTTGSSQVSEVYAGSSYYSQDSSVATFGIPIGTAVRSVRVSWPDGSRSEQEAPSDALRIEVRAPGR